MTRSQIKENKEEQEISIIELWGILREHIIYILGVALIIGILSFGYSKFLVEPLYTSTVTLYVTSNNKYTQNDTIANAQTEYRYTTEVINTYIEILKTKSFFEEISNAIGKRYTAEELEKMVTIQSVTGTEVIKVSATTNQAAFSYNIAEVFSRLSSQKIESVKSEHLVKVVDPPRIEDKASNDKTLINTAIGTLLGGLLAYMTYLIKAMIDKRIKTPEDITKKFEYPLIGIIPDFTKGTETAYSQNEKNKQSTRKNIQISNGQNFAVQEAYKALRSNINFSIINKECKTVLMTSTLPSEGKTTTCTYLAKAIAQMENKVLIIDADLRKPRLHTYFDKQNQNGTSNLAAGMCKENEVIQKTQNSYLDIITAGEIPPNPSELLNSQNMKNALQNLKKQYDYIIIDTPPLGVVSDALGLVENIDGYIVIAKAGKTEWPILDDVIYNLEFAKAKISGIVLNGFIESKTGKYGYKYKAKYKY